MAIYSDKNVLKTAISNDIKTNNRNETSSLKIQSQLINIVDSFVFQQEVDEINEYIANTRQQGSFYVPVDYDLTQLNLVSSDTQIIITNIHDLSGATFTLSNKTIVFNGGQINNGNIQFENVNLIASRRLLFGDLGAFTVSGTILNDIYPEWFYPYPNGGNSWEFALTKALKLASYSSGRVLLDNRVYFYTGQLTVEAGVTIEGSGRGETAFGGGPTRGTVLHSLGSAIDPYTIDNIAIKVVGKMATLKNFTLKGRRGLTLLGSGIVFYGVGNGSSSVALLEGCLVSDLLIHGFEGTGACGLKLVAGNSGSITYSNFNNIRIRDCSHHLKIECLSADPIYGNIGSTGLPYSNINCFINSNNFNGLYSSGYCISGIHIRTEKDLLQTNSQDVYRPANNLTFNAIVLEAPTSALGHIKLEGGGASVRMTDIRIEALNQDSVYPAVPVVNLGVGVNGVKIELDQSTVTFIDLGFNNEIISKSTKSALATNKGDSLYRNSSLLGLEEVSGLWSLPEWTIEEQFVGTVGTYAWRPLQTDSEISIQYDDTVFIEDGYKVIKIIVPPNYHFRVNQPIARELHKIPTGRVNAWVKTDALKNVIWTYQDSVTPLLSGGTTWGLGDFEQIGALFNITSPDVSSYFRISLFCQNYTETDKEFWFTMPSFVVGQETPRVPGKPMLDTGGTYYGTVGHNVVKNILPVSNAVHRGATSSDIILPKQGNYFEFNEAGFSVQKINATTNRFNRGDVITLFFNYEGVTVIDSSFINLQKPYISEVNSTITLQTPDGNGLWKEITRSERKKTGYQVVDINNVISTNFLVLDRTNNVFDITNTTNGVFTINRINEVIKFDEGDIITLKFISPGDNISINNSAYITLSRPIEWKPMNNGWIQLQTKGNGTWVEIARIKSPLDTSKHGYSIIETSTATVSTEITVSTAGERYFSFNNTSGGVITITKINQVLAKRLEPGVEILIRFGTLTSGISINPNAYLVMKYTGSFVPLTGDWIKFITDGTGTWMELDRKLSSANPPVMSLTLSTTYLNTAFLELPLTGENYFKLSAATLGGSISRINNTTRFGGGKIIMLEFTNVTNAVTLVHGGYIILTGAVNYIPAVNGGIVLYTSGNGVWRELSRF